MRDLLVAVSAANLTFIAVWRRLILASPADRFWTRIPTGEDAVAAILNVLLLAAVLYGLLKLARRMPEGALRNLLSAAPALALLVPLSTVFGGNGPLETFGHYGLWIVYLMAFAVGVFVLYRWRRAVFALLLIISPFVVFTVGQAAWLAAGSSAPPLPNGIGPPAPLPRPAATRVVMLIFDEMEQRLAFGERPAGLELPNLDRLRAESFAAERAQPPGNGTHVSIPTLLTGKKVTAARPESATELFIRYEGAAEPARLTAEPHLFRDAHAAGLRTAVVGWHLPYCRVFGQYLTSCFAQPRRDPEPREKSVGTAMLRQVQSLFYLLERKEHIYEYQSLMEHARAAVANPEFDFVYLHLPVPHGPPVYDRNAQRLTITNFSREWYFDNLALADRALGELRQSMEAAGVWERTALVMTSDHVWLLAHKYVGSRDEHVPLIVRLPGSREGHEYQETSAIVAHDAVLGLLRGELRTRDDLGRLIEGK